MWIKDKSFLKPFEKNFQTSINLKFLYSLNFRAKNFGQSSGYDVIKKIEVIKGATRLK